MARIGAKKLYLPAIQRKFVWEPRQIEELFDSIMRDYPIGTFLFWMVEEAKHNDYSFYEFIRDYHARDNWRNPLAAKPHLPNELVGVLDGQQRLNSMYVALQGTYAYRRPRVWSTNPNAYPVREFYINVLKRESEEEGDDHVYEFSFLTPEGAKAVASETCWCLVKDVLECKGIPDVARLWAKRTAEIPSEVQLPEDAEERATAILLRLWERLTTKPIINYFPVSNQNLDEVLDIFVRVNSAGTPLSKTDLLFSTIVARWEDGRQAIETFLQKLNGKGAGFAFDTDFIMRACLVLAECPVRLRVASFKAENVDRIVREWKEITSAIERAVDLLADWGFQATTLSSLNAVIPVAYATKVGFDLKASKTDLRLLLVKSLLLGTYGSSADQVLSSIRRTMAELRKTSTAFGLAEFEKKVRLPGAKSLTITEETLDELVVSTIGGRTFALLSLLSPHLKFNQVQFHQDHIHPWSGFTNAALKKLNLPEDQFAEWQAKRDTLPNLQLLEGKENQAKLATRFGKWLKKEYPKEQEASAFLRTHHIPDVSLDFENFPEFFDARRRVLKEKLAGLLGVTVTQTAVP